MFKRAYGIALAATVLPTALAAAAVPASAAQAAHRPATVRSSTSVPDTAAVGQIQNVYNSQCLDGKASNNGGVTMQTCTSYSADGQEYWILEPSNNGDQLKNKYNGQCLDGKASNNGGVTMRQCTSYSADGQEYWSFDLPVG